MADTLDALVERELAARLQGSVDHAGDDNISSRIETLVEIHNQLSEGAEYVLLPLITPDEVHNILTTCKWRRYLPEVPANQLVSDTDYVDYSYDIALATRQWLFKLLRVHKNWKRTYLLPLLRSALTADGWDNDVKNLYMLLTHPDLDDTRTRLRHALAFCLDLGYLKKHGRVPDRAQQHVAWEKAAKRKIQLSRETFKRRKELFRRARVSQVDDFVSAVVPTQQELGECDICQESHINYESDKLERDLADYPVQIKYCGHIMGKACLQEWVALGPMNAAKQPYVTCPMCRIRITRKHSPDILPNWEVAKHELQGLIPVKKCTGANSKEQSKAIKMLLNEETATIDMLRRLQERKLGQKHKLSVEEVEDLEKMEETLLGKRNAIRLEKSIWNFPSEQWAMMHSHWVKKGYQKQAGSRRLFNPALGVDDGYSDSEDSEYSQDTVWEESHDANTASVGTQVDLQ